MIRTHRVKENIKDSLISLRAPEIATLSGKKISRFDYLIHLSHQHRYVYCEIPKAGCSTIKRTLHQLETQSHLSHALHDVHNLRHSPLISPLKLKAQFTHEITGNYTFFSQVRNPYTRILSCYLDKLQLENTDVRHYLGILRIRGQPSFQQFLERLASRADLLSTDIHWTPQTQLLCLDRIRYDHVLRFESFPENFLHLLQQVLKLDVSPYFASEKAHETQAGKRIDSYYTPKTIALVQELYHEDFTKLGYSTDIHAACQ